MNNVIKATAEYLKTRRAYGTTLFLKRQTFTTLCCFNLKIQVTTPRKATFQQPSDCIRRFRIQFHYQVFGDIYEHNGTAF
jgi:hypothetical protein